MPLKELFNLSHDLSSLSSGFGLCLVSPGFAFRFYPCRFVGLLLLFVVVVVFSSPFPSSIMLPVVLFFTCIRKRDGDRLLDR